MLDFDLGMYLEDMEGLSIQEKIKSLDNLYSELEDAAAEVLSYRDGISDEYEAKIKTKVNEEMQSFIAERHLEESVSKLKEGWYVVKTAQDKINIFILCGGGELRISLWIKDIYDNAKRYEMLSSIANKVGIPYKNGSDDISLNVEEENLLPKLKDIISKFLVKEYTKNNYEDLLEDMRKCFSEGHFVKDGLLYRGDIRYYSDGGYWERDPIGNNSDLDEWGLWNKVPLRVMFLMKDYTNESMTDIRFETGRKNGIRKEQDLIKRDAFTMNIVYWLYGLTHQGVNFDEIKEGSKCFSFYERYPLARINCKKISGGSICLNKTLQEYLVTPGYSELLMKQIQLFHSDVIVCCGGGSCISKFVKERCYSKNNWQQFEDESLWYNEKEKILVIDTYHPSCRYSRKKLFEGVTSCFQRFVTTQKDFMNKLKEMKDFENGTMNSMPYIIKHENKNL